MATAKKDDALTIEEQTIMTQRMTADPSLIKIDADGIFTLQPGHYNIKVQIGNGTSFATRTRLIDVSKPDNPVNIEYSTSNQLVGDIITTGEEKYLIQQLKGRQWQPIQTLPPSDYTCTITLLS